MDIEDLQKILEAGIGLLDPGLQALEYLKRDPQLDTLRI
jgi:hypothetical protein